MSSTASNETVVFTCGFVWQKKETRKGGKSKKTQLRFSINCATPVEDEIMDAGAFVSLGAFSLCVEVLYSCRVRATFPSPYSLSPPPPCCCRRSF